MKAFGKWTASGLYVVLLALIAAGCADLRLRGVVGNYGHYNYSPSVIETGQTRQIWWCSPGVNPNDHSQNTDAIYYESFDKVTYENQGPVLVLAETPGAWDSAYLCNPKVIGGVFRNPLDDGQDYTYALYYVATADPSGVNNSIGVAFSKDGIHWKKYPDPVIHSSTATGYGVGQPALYNSDKKSMISMFYEDSVPSVNHIAAVSTDGVHFNVVGPITKNGMDPDDPDPIWGDMSYDSSKREWYAVFNRELRNASTTAGIQERGQLGVELYKIPADSLLTGASPWQLLAVFDTNSTGHESNFIAALVHDPYGNINLPSYPAVQMYTSVSYSQPAWNATPSEAAKSATPESWLIVPMQWNPTAGPLLSLNRYVNSQVHEVTTGWVSPSAGFRQESVLGHLYQAPLEGASLPLYGCKRDDKDYFVSRDSGCEGQRMLGKQGYAYLEPIAGTKLVALYRCKTASDHFVSRDSHCEGSTFDQLLAYVLP